MFSSNSSQVSQDAVFIEDIFSTYLYTGNSTSGGTQTITNNIDLSTKGGMVWIKGRSAASDHILSDTARGAGASATNNNALASNLTSAEDLGGSSYDFLSAFNADGFTVKQGGTTTATRGANYNNVTYTSWTFRKQPKFFDVVTWTGASGLVTVPHNLGSAPGFIVVKRTDATSDWIVGTSALNSGFGPYRDTLYLNKTDAANVGAGDINSANSTEFTTYVGPGTWVAYLFAHDAGGFGTAGTDNVISCGSYTTVGGEASINLGYEPQWVMVKRSDGVGDWFIINNMMALANDGLYGELNYSLSPNTSSAQANFASPYATATGFENNGWLASAGTFIYVAIRRGPMRVPTDGTSVFATQATADAVTANSKTTYRFTSNFPIDLSIMGYRDGGVNNSIVTDRLRGFSQTTTGNAAQLTTSNSNAELSGSPAQFDNMLGQTSSATLIASSNFNAWMFCRAPGFFDEVCYTGTGSNTTQTHNLGVVPELMIVKRRDTTGAWDTYSAALANTEYLVLNTTAAKATGATRWNSTTPTSSVFSLGTSTTVNASGGTYVAYLFASCPGVSKVGSYTGSGTTKQIDCGFTGGARFVLIKRTDSTGDWYVWDTARGIVSGNDPYLLLNSTAAEVTNTDYIDAYSAGFEISSTAPAAINASGGTFVFFAIS